MFMRINLVFFVPVLLASLGARADLPSFNIARIDRDRVLKQADEFLNLEPVTITAFHSDRSAGGVHDYFSEGDYWWPDPKAPDPEAPTAKYIQRDGMTNPKNFIAHRHALMQLSIQFPALVAAYKLTHDDKYSAHAIKHLHAWFINDATKMNPNLQYAQAIHGITTGRGTGIIDTLHLAEVARGIQVLERENAFKGDDDAAVKKWFADYLNWMSTSKNGQDEMNAKNNHATCWFAQASAFATLVGDEGKRSDYRQHYKEVLLPNQMAADGSFPQELRRTKPYSYSLFNLDAMCTVCRILSTPADNLWTFTTPEGKNIRKGVDFMFPYIKDKKNWPKPPDVMFYEFWPVRSASLFFAAQAYDEPKYFDLWKTLGSSPTNEEVLRNVPIRQPVLWME
jgi:hypothetical protein